ncbi:hypothetical protein CKAH01_14890 [Colletotrichum kahawae]|uniref:SnoaL-like domain-containing protein n=1 Tax=Colletotrichum kahawae TaxID=34407 RepID=A0AAD9YN27_COLKA|nr:hypothetical protein CKAH01_14890 [Colletotrichum kahawae]
MAAPDDEESFRRFLEEMSDGSRDYGIRKTLDQRVRTYFQTIDAGRIDEMVRWYADDVIRILGVQVPGSIWKGKKEVIASHERDLEGRKRGGWTVVTIPTWVIVDRGRITCRFERFFSRQICKEIKKYTFVLVFDLDSTGHVKRIEYRKISDSTEDRPIEELVCESKAKQEDMQTCLEF